MSDSNPRKALLPRTQLDCYRIVRLIGSGGFSLIYLARDEETQDEVAIKEYFPKQYATRADDYRITLNENSRISSFNRGLKLFFLEARALANLRHANIVNVRNCFLENDSA